MHVRKAALADEFQTRRKFLLGFTGERHDHIGCHSAVGEMRLQQFHTFQISGRIVFTLHASQNGITAGLHGQMELRA